METAARDLGEPVWIAAARVDRTRGVGQQELELCDDGNIDGLQLAETLGEHAERFLMLEHQFVSHHEMGRSAALECREVEERDQSGRELPALGDGAESGGAHDELAAAPGIGAAREGSVESTTPDSRPDAG
jgi:hypothetical protein